MRRIIYIYQQPDWPKFTWNKDELMKVLAGVRYKQGLLLGRMAGMGFDLKNEAVLKTLTTDVIKSSEIEGEKLDKEQVRSSVARHLGIQTPGLVPSERHIEGVVEMMIDATRSFEKPLKDKRLFAWHASMFPGGWSGMHKIKTGSWRNHSKEDPMQVVSGAMGKEKVHFQAPDAEEVPEYMQEFLDWFNSETSMDPVMKAAVAHLWFVTIHPFDDGNGRIARAITDLQLARADQSPDRFYSMSAQIRKERKHYYTMLEKTQQGSLDITGWIRWFLECLERALDGTEEVVETILGKATFWDNHALTSLNDRQRKMVNLLFDGFEGKLTSSKWAKINKVSQDTAGRDINDLIEKGILEKEEGGGRSTSYGLRGK